VREGKPSLDDMKSKMPYGMQRMHIQQELHEIECAIVFDCIIIIIQI